MKVKVNCVSVYLLSHTGWNSLLFVLLKPLLQTGFAFFLGPFALADLQAPVLFNILFYQPDIVPDIDELFSAQHLHTLTAGIWILKLTCQNFKLAWCKLSAHEPSHEFSFVQCLFFCLFKVVVCQRAHFGILIRAGNLVKWVKTLGLRLKVRVKARHVWLECLLVEFEPRVLVFAVIRGGLDVDLAFVVFVDIQVLVILIKVTKASAWFRLAELVLNSVNTRMVVMQKFTAVVGAALFNMSLVLQNFLVNIDLGLLVLKPVINRFLRPFICDSLVNLLLQVIRRARFDCFTIEKLVVELLLHFV